MLNPRQENSNIPIGKVDYDLLLDAILSGKYSWACVLFLSFYGYDPAHYLPYRTYNRILKTNVVKPKDDKTLPMMKGKSTTTNLNSRNKQIDIHELNLLDNSNNSISKEINGGFLLAFCENYID